MTGSVVIGNDATPTVLIFGFDRARGSYSAAKVCARDLSCIQSIPAEAGSATWQARSKLDAWKEVYSFNFQRPKVIMRTNPDYRGPLLDLGKQAWEELKRKQCVLDPDALAAFS